MEDKVYSLKQLEDLSGGDKEFIMDMVQTFLEHTPGQLEDLKTALESGDFPNMGAMAHKIKPNIDLFGISNITAEIREVERIGKTGQSAPELVDLIKKIDSILSESFVQLKQYK